MLQTECLIKVRNLLSRIESTQASKVDAAADVVAQALATGHGFFVAPLGHGNDGDLLHRAGGLMALNPFNFAFNVEKAIAAALHDRPRAEPFDLELETALLAVRASELRGGDCLILGSVSGRSSRWVATAIAAREIGVTVIAVTSMEYTERVKRLCPEGRRLCDVADIVLDNCVPYGDACLNVDGLAAPVFPLSGLATITLCWMLCAQVIEKLLARGLRPHVYLSANMEGGPEFNERERAEYEKVGY